MMLRCVKIFCLSFCVIAMACSSGEKDLTQIAYTYTLATKHSGGSGEGSNIAQFMDSFVKVNAGQYETIKLELKNGDAIAFNRPFEAQKTEILINEKAQRYTFEVDTLSKIEMQQIINLRFSDFEQFMKNLGQ